jgi:hypothetical protein
MPPSRDGGPHRDPEGEDRGPERGPVALSKSVATATEQRKAENADCKELMANDSAAKEPRAHMQSKGSAAPAPPPETFGPSSPCGSCDSPCGSCGRQARRGRHAKDLEDLKAMSAHHATVQEHLNYLEKLLGDSADKHAQEPQALKDAHAKHASDLAHHASLPERINYLEKCFGDSADKHAKSWRPTRALMPSMRMSSPGTPRTPTTNT